MPPLQPTGFSENSILSHVTVLKEWHKKKKRSKMLSIGFWIKYDVIVVIETTFTTKQPTGFVQNSMLNHMTALKRCHNEE